MGERYQNKLDEEAEQEFWKHAPWWKRLCYWIFMLVGGLLALYGSIGWIIIKIFNG